MQRFKNYLRVAKYSVTVVTVFWFTWLACAADWGVEVRWVQYEKTKEMDNVQTIVAYSVKKLEEMTTPISCNRLPIMPEPRKINRTWSPHVSWNGSATWQQVAGTSLRLFDAYYDARLSKHYIRIIATYPGRSIPPTLTLFCQTRQHQKQNVQEASVQVVTAVPTTMWASNWDTRFLGAVMPYLLTCALTGPLDQPSVVSVVTETCQDPTNAFLVKPIKSKSTTSRNFTICVKDMIFNKDVSQNLVEWIETNKLLGVEKIDMYVEDIHENVQNVLKYYRDEGLVRLFQVPVNHKVDPGIWQRRKDHVVTYNDCLYRNIHETRILIPLDVDEIIVPKIARNLHGLVRRLFASGWKPKSMAAVVRNLFFFDTIQSHKEKIQNKYFNLCKKYSKRDAVRLINRIGLSVLNISSSNKIIDDVANEETLRTAYNKRCGVDMTEPKFTRNILRSKQISPKSTYAKSMMLTKNVLIAFNHYPLAPLRPESERFYAPIHEVQLNHYRVACNYNITTDCQLYEKSSVADCHMMRLRKELLKALATNAPCARLTNEIV